MCPDCDNGYYYPLMGPRESCKTCQNPTMQDSFGNNFGVGDRLALDPAEIRKSAYPNDPLKWEMECIEIRDGLATFECLEGGHCGTGPRSESSFHEPGFDGYRLIPKSKDNYEQTFCTTRQR